MKRVFNFSAGPSVLPQSVLKTAAEEMLDYKGSGQSVMEMSHRSKIYESIIEEAESLLRELMGIPENYSVLFLQGGASLQFSMIPLNILPEGGFADFIETGVWAKKAASEVSLFGKANITATSKDRNFCYIPEFAGVTEGASYVHITTNNTIYGTKFNSIPSTGNTPLVADMSSNILSEPIDVSKFALIYAGAQKNLGPAGVTIVIVRKDLIGRHRSGTPTMLRYDIHDKEKSLYNTPACYSIYMVKLVLEWVKSLGGTEVMAKLNKEKASILYDFLDSSRLFTATADKSDRSLMNVPFVLPSEELTSTCIKQAEAEGFINLKGHRLVGGMRASIYNAMPKEGVSALVDFLKKFEAANGGQNV